MKNKTFLIITAVIVIALIGTLFFYPQMLAKIGDHFLKYNNFNQAINFYGKALKEGKHSSKLYSNLGICFFGLNRMKAANQSLKKALDLDKNNEYAIFYLGLISSNFKAYPTALKYYSKTIEINPKLVDAYNARAGAYEMLGQPLKAEQDLLKCIELESNYAIGYFNLAQIYDTRGDRKKAISYYNQFLTKSTPSMTELLENANQRLIELNK